MLHVMFEKYGFFAVTPSLGTLQRLISLVENENRVWQRRFDTGGTYTRYFNFLEDDVLLNAQYELVVLHPEHFLPKGSDLTFYTHANGQLSGKRYIIGEDRTLREFPGTLDCARLPAFAFDAVRRSMPLNVFLVVLNAEIKFRRFRRMGLAHLANDVESLIDVTIKLADLIYWSPVVTLTRYRQVWNNDTTAMATAMDVQDIEMGRRTSADEDNEETIQSSHYRARRRPGADATMEEQREYAHYLLSGQDLDSDDEDLLEELGLTPGSLIERPAAQGTSIGVTSHEDIRGWQQAVEVQ